MSDDLSAYDFEPECSTKGHGDLDGPLSVMHDDGPAVFSIMSSCPNCRKVSEQLACNMIAQLFFIDLHFNSDLVYLCNECDFMCTLRERNFEFLEL